MGAVVRWVAFTVSCLDCVGFARAADVRVVDHNGAPVPDAAVVCLGREVGRANAGPDGVAVIPGACKKVWCERGDFVGVEATLYDGKALCQFPPAVMMAVEPLPPGCEDDPGCLALLRSAISPTDNRSDEYRPPHRTFPGWAPAKEFRFTPTRPGRFQLVVERLRDDWSCGADLGDIPAGERTITPTWREPASIHGVVVGVDDKPRAGVPIRVRPRRLNAGEASVGVWLCTSGRFQISPVRSAVDGGFTVLVDSMEKPTIEAGAPDDPDGYASVVLDALPQAPLVLKLHQTAPAR